MKQSSSPSVRLWCRQPTYRWIFFRCLIGAAICWLSNIPTILNATNKDDGKDMTLPHYLRSSIESRRNLNISVQTEVENIRGSHTRNINDIMLTKHTHTKTERTKRSESKGTSKEQQITNASTIADRSESKRAGKTNVKSEELISKSSQRFTRVWQSWNYSNNQTWCHPGTDREKRILLR